MTLVINITEAFFIVSFLGYHKIFRFRSIFLSDAVDILGSVRDCRIIRKYSWLLLAEQISLTPILIWFSFFRFFVSNVGGDLFLILGFECWIEGLCFLSSYFWGFRLCISLLDCTLTDSLYNHVLTFDFTLLVHILFVVLFIV